MQSAKSSLLNQKLSSNGESGNNEIHLSENYSREWETFSLSTSQNSTLGYGIQDANSSISCSNGSSGKEINLEHLIHTTGMKNAAQKTKKQSAKNAKPKIFKRSQSLAPDNNNISQSTEGDLLDDTTLHHCDKPHNEKDSPDLNKKINASRSLSSRWKSFAQEINNFRKKETKKKKITIENKENFLLKKAIKASLVNAATISLITRIALLILSSYHRNGSVGYHEYLLSSAIINIISRCASLYSILKATLDIYRDRTSPRHSTRLDCTLIILIMLSTSIGMLCNILGVIFCIASQNYATFDYKNGISISGFCDITMYSFTLVLSSILRIKKHLQSKSKSKVDSIMLTLGLTSEFIMVASRILNILENSGYLDTKLPFSLFKTILVVFTIFSIVLSIVSHYNSFEKFTDSCMSILDAKDPDSTNIQQNIFNIALDEMLVYQSLAMHVSSSENFLKSILKEISEFHPDRSQPLLKEDFNNEILQCANIPQTIRRQRSNSDPQMYCNIQDIPSSTMQEAFSQVVKNNAARAAL